MRFAKAPFHAGLDHAVTVRYLQEDRVSRYPGPVTRQCFECSGLEDDVPFFRELCKLKGLDDSLGAYHLMNHAKERRSIAGFI